jgi:hypothetical protein
VAEIVNHENSDGGSTAARSLGGEHVPADSEACVAAEIPADWSGIRARRRAERSMAVRVFLPVGIGGGCLLKLGSTAASVGGGSGKRNG